MQKETEMYITEIILIGIIYIRTEMCVAACGYGKPLIKHLVSRRQLWVPAGCCVP
jgi:hypothetical protein